MTTMVVSFVLIIICQDFTDEGLQSLSQGFRYLGALQTIILDLGW